MAGNADGTRTVKVTAETHATLEQLVEQVQRDGWRSLGIDKPGNATLGGIVDAVISHLAKARLKRRGSG